MTCLTYPKALHRWYVTLDLKPLALADPLQSILEALASQRKSDFLLEVFDRALRHNRAYRRTNEWFRMLYNAHNRHLDHFPAGNPLDSVEEENFFAMDALQKVFDIQCSRSRAGLTFEGFGAVLDL